MEHMGLDEIIKAVHGEKIINGIKDNFTAVSTDTRKIKEGDIFIALKGDKYNGNEFVMKAAEKGASLCIIDEIIGDLSLLEGKTHIIKTDNNREALINLARYYRETLNLKVIGVTGSTGKTSTKDLIFAALSSKFKVFKTIGNFNNDIGLPLMIFNLDNTYDIAVLEMGMSDFGEVHKLSYIARPDLAVITNIGISHIQNLKSRENILKAKMEITDYFTKDNCLIVNNDNDLLSGLCITDYELISTGTQPDSAFKAENIILNEESVQFDVMEKGEFLGRFFIDIPGIHTVNNALISIACARRFNMEAKDIQFGLKNIQTTSMRLQIIHSDIKTGKITIVNDAYNASPDSMRAGIEVFSNLKCNRKIAVLGTMRELGDSSFKAHEEVGKFAKEASIDCLITIGDYNEAYSLGYGLKENFYSFNSKEEALKFIKTYIKDGDGVFVKASRTMKFEDIVEGLKNINS